MGNGYGASLLHRTPTSYIVVIIIEIWYSVVCIGLWGSDYGASLLQRTPTSYIVIMIIIIIYRMAARLGSKRVGKKVPAPTLENQ